MRRSSEAISPPVLVGKWPSLAATQKAASVLGFLPLWDPSRQSLIAPTFVINNPTFLIHNSSEKSPSRAARRPLFQRRKGVNDSSLLWEKWAL